MKRHILNDIEMFSGLQYEVPITLNASERKVFFFYCNRARLSVQLTFRAKIVLFYGESYPAHRNCEN